MNETSGKHCSPKGTLSISYESYLHKAHGGSATHQVYATQDSYTKD